MQKLDSEPSNGLISSELVEQLVCLMESFTVASMSRKPKDLEEFAAEYFSKLKKRKDVVQERGISNLKTGFYLAEDFTGHI